MRALPTRCLGAALLAACGDGSGPSGGSVDCAEVTATTLAVGEHTIFDAAEVGCVQVPAAGAEGAEHLYVALLGQGGETRDGITAAYTLTADPVATAAAALAGVRARVVRPAPSAAAKFHDAIRARERELVAGRPAGVSPPTQVRDAAVPPAVGDRRTFKVCESPTCSEFADVAATAQVVGQRVAVFVDDAAPAGGYTQLDLLEVGDLFDDFLYPIDTAAYGAESDLDGNDVVVVLLSTRVNQLVPNCNSTGSVVAGYFFGLDLLPDRANSNRGEVFYGLAPDPGDPSCTITREEALDILPPVFAHEFMHMIGFNQGVLVRAARTVEETWLDEGLAHFAEELAGRLVPDEVCQPAYASCERRFIRGNLRNAQLYLEEPEEAFLIEPDTSSGELAERGANWLFLRWLADHYSASQPSAVELTRALVQTTLRGSANVEAVTGEPFDDLLARWQLANYLEDLPGFTPGDETLRYTSWAFRDEYATYPLAPDIVGTGAYSHTGTLRGGSGRHLRIAQPASAAPVTLRLTRDDGASTLSGDAEPRIALIRIR